MGIERTQFQIFQSWFFLPRTTPFHILTDPCRRKNYSYFKYRSIATAEWVTCISSNLSSVQ